jgi:hypothetical protein
MSIGSTGGAPVMFSVSSLRAAAISRRRRIAPANVKPGRSIVNASSQSVQFGLGKKTCTCQDAGTGGALPLALPVKSHAVLCKRPAHGIGERDGR